jgi:DNA-binding YbaB/EbfC family protein
MGSGFSKMKKQARMLEQQVEEMRQKMQNATYTGTSGNGLVTVTVNGEKELQKIAIQPACVDPQDVEGLQDLIRAACENAYAQIAKESPGMGGMGGSLGLPFGF